MIRKLMLHVEGEILHVVRAELWCCGVGPLPLGAHPTARGHPWVWPSGKESQIPSHSAGKASPRAVLYRLRKQQPKL